MFLLKDLFTQLFKQACSLTMRNKHNSDCKQMKCELCEMLQRKRCFGNKLESFHGNFMRLYGYALFLRTIYAYLRLWSFESGCMHNLLNSIPEMPEILDLLDFALGLRQLRICGKLQEVEGIA